MSHHQIGDERLAKKNDLTRSIVLQYLNLGMNDTCIA